MKNPKIERAMDALTSIFDLKKDIGKSVKRAKDRAAAFGIQGVFAVKEFSDAIDELFKADEKASSETNPGVSNQTKGKAEEVSKEEP